MSPTCGRRAGESLAARHAAPSLLSLSEARPRSVLIAACKCLHGDKIPGTKGLFNLAVIDRPRTSSWKQKPRESYLERRHVVNGGRERGSSAQGHSDQGWTAPWQRSLTERGAGECRGAGGRALALCTGVVRPTMTRQCGPITLVGKLRHGGAEV